MVMTGCGLEAVLEAKRPPEKIHWTARSSDLGIIYVRSSLVCVHGPAHSSLGHLRAPGREFRCCSLYSSGLASDDDSW